MIECCSANNATSADDVPGGSFTLGTTDSTQFKGDIEYYNIPNGEESWWLLPLECETAHCPFHTATDY